MTLAGILLLSIGLPFGYLFCSGVMYNSLLKRGWDEVSNSAGTTFAVIFWPFVFPIVMGLQFTKLFSVINKKIEERKAVKVAKVMPKSIDNIKDYRHMKLLVENFEENMSICER